MPTINIHTDAARPKPHGEHAEFADLSAVKTRDLPTKAAEDVAYGPNGVRGIISSPYILFAAFVASLGGFSFGYDQGVISIINVMDQFHTVYPFAATGFGKGFMTGMLELGAFLGCFFMPWLADKISRKRALVVVVVIFNIGAILQTAAVNYGMLVAGRTIGGIGVGTLALVSLDHSLALQVIASSLFIDLFLRVLPCTFPKFRPRTYEVHC
jgi:MFS family permease